MKTIEIIVSSKGETKVETKGFTGSSCREVSKFLEQALGEKTNELMTPEYYQPQVVHQTQQTSR